jgi:SAM-dependent methyltransferase
MLDGLHRRARKAGLADRIETRIAASGSLAIADLAGGVDFVLASAVVHEMPSAARFFLETASVLKPGALLLLVEPAGHVGSAAFAGEIQAATHAGFASIASPIIRGSYAALLRRSGA